MVDVDDAGLVDELLASYRELREKRTAEAAASMLERLKEFSPPGVEWGIELVRLPGISYIAEGGRIIALSVSREEFGPFMQSSIRQVEASSIPREALRQIVENPDGFIDRVKRHLSSWLASAPSGHPLRRRVELLLESLY